MLMKMERLTFPDDTLTYTITATNTGTTTQTDVVVTDPLLTPSTITCASVAPGATCVLSGDYTVTQTDVDNGQIVNTAEVVSDDITTPVTDGETTPVNQTRLLSTSLPRLMLMKMVTARFLQATR